MNISVDIKPKNFKHRTIFDPVPFYALSIFLIDHAWTYRFDKARAQLETTPNLLPRMASLMDLSVEGKDKDQLIDEVLDEMWR